MTIIVEAAYSFTRTVPQLVAKVLRKLGAIGIDEATSSEDTAVVREAMDMRLKELHALGTLWFNVAGAATSLTLVSGSASIALGLSDFLYPVSMKLRIGTEDRDVEIITHAEYQSILDKTETGEPEKVFIASDGTAYFWPTPNANYTAKMTYQAVAEDTNAVGAPDVPVAMQNAFTDLIAGDLVEEFNVPERKATRILDYAKEAERKIRILNSPRVDNVTVEIEFF
jgi:hypothetical protein